MKNTKIKHKLYAKFIDFKRSFNNLFRKKVYNIILEKHSKKRYIQKGRCKNKKNYAKTIKMQKHFKKNKGDAKKTIQKQK